MTTLAADRWLYTTITGDSVLQAIIGNRVYADVAPQGTAYPVVIITFVSSRHIGNISQDRVYDDELWQITAWDDDPSYATLEQIADRIRAILHKASGSGVIAAVYEGMRRINQIESGRIYKGIVLEVRIFVQ